MFTLPLLLALCQVIFSATFSGIVVNSVAEQKVNSTSMELEQEVASSSTMTEMTPLDYAKKFVSDTLGFNPGEYIVKDVYTSDHNKATHIYLKQIKLGYEVLRGDININVSACGEILSYGDSFIRIKSHLKNNSGGKSLPVIEAIEVLMKHLDIKKKVPIVVIPPKSKNSKEFLLQNVPGALHDTRAIEVLIELEDGSLEQVWDFKLELEKDYYHAQVSTSSKKVVGILNWASNASYKVIPFGKSDPGNTDRKLIKDPYDKNASPLGWHSFRKKNMINKDTAGNNVYAVVVNAGNPNELDPISRVKGDKNLKFDFPMDMEKDPHFYIEAATTNLFYYSNMMHDLLYCYGFNEVAGSFQENNFKKGGKENDAVIAHVQEGSASNNAYFKTPPDGEHGVMFMGINDRVNPKRDSDFDSGVMIHEYAHGLSNRLTGGPANSDCLNGLEQGGLGEGWSDFVAIMILMNKNTKETESFGVGSYFSNTRTLRNYLYSTDMRVNPSTFKFLGLNKYKEVHNVGEIWTSMLFEVYWSLQKKLPVTNDWFKQAENPKKHANTLLLQLIIDGMKLQKCRPTFLDARNAILLAEKIYTKEKYKCALWKGFAKRGLGEKAEISTKDSTKSYKNSFLVPKGC